MIKEIRDGHTYECVADLKGEDNMTFKEANTGDRTHEKQIAFGIVYSLTTCISCARKKECREKRQNIKYCNFKTLYADGERTT